MALRRIYSNSDAVHPYLQTLLRSYQICEIVIDRRRTPIADPINERRAEVHRSIASSGLSCQGNKAVELMVDNTRVGIIIREGQSV